MAEENISQNLHRKILMKKDLFRRRDRTKWIDD